MVRRKGYPTESAYFDRKIDAQSWARSIETKIDEGKHPVGSEARKHTLGDLIDRYCLEVLPQKKSKRDQHHKLGVWKNLLGDLKLSELTPNRLLNARSDIFFRPFTSPGVVARVALPASRSFPATAAQLKNTTSPAQATQPNPSLLLR
jgi:hypothetical protein